MTVKFFSLFFMQICEMSPISVSLISLGAMVGVTLAAAACQRLSARFVYACMWLHTYY